jgi:2-keto-4-pentenoate hydratase/2-oxohepta-3-ene-1,7-dioic acid hydratase in catechol pathway
VIKKSARHVTEAQVKDFILGYTCFNDVTARDLQPKNGQWTLAKSFDTFSPIGPWIVTDVDPSSLEIASYLNGERRQFPTQEFNLQLPNLVSYVSRS